MIELQKLLFPAKMEKEKRALYYDSKEKLEYGPANGEIFLQDGQKIVFDTYLNSFSAGKWKKYTMVTEVSLKMIFQGKFRIVLYHKFLHQGVCHTKKISEQIIEAEKKRRKNTGIWHIGENGNFLLLMQEHRRNRNPVRRSICYKRCPQKTRSSGAEHLHI